MELKSTIVPYSGYGYGAMERPRASRYDAETGDWYVMGDDLKIYNCHPVDNEGRWPIRFAIREYDLAYPRVKSLFE